MVEDRSAPKCSVVPKEEELLAYAERSPGGDEVPYPLLARRDGQDPEVRDGEVPPVDSLPPRLAIGDELAPEGGLPESLPQDRHRPAVRFEEEVRTPAVLRLVPESKAEDPIRFHSEAVERAALPNLEHLPTERQPEPPGGFRWRGEDLFRLDERHVFSRAASRIEAHHDLGDREGVAEERARQAPVLRVPPEGAPPQFALGGENPGAAVPQGIGQRFRALGVPLELRGWPVEIAVVEKELQPPECRLPAAIQERYEMRGAKESVAVNGTEDLKIAGREHQRLDRCTVEARAAR